MTFSQALVTICLVLFGPAYVGWIFYWISKFWTVGRLRGVEHFSRSKSQ
jgi:hypothetical protein